MIKRSIWVTFTRHGIHRYPDAPGEVSYLRYPHRHLFHFKITMDVFHDDREVEFHMLQAFAESQYDSGVLQLNNKSCEMLAEDLLQILQIKYPNRAISVEVSEDMECGAVVSTE